MSKYYAIHYYNENSDGDWYIFIANSYEEAIDEGLDAACEILNGEFPDADAWEVKASCPMSTYEMERELQSSHPYDFIEQWCVTNL